MFGLLVNLFYFPSIFVSRRASSALSSAEPPSYYSNGFGSRSNNFVYSTSSLSRMLSRSPEWAGVSQKEKDKLGLTLKDDGEFWLVHLKYSYYYMYATEKGKKGIEF